MTRTATAQPQPSEATMPPTRFGLYAWGVLAYTLFVIVFGAWVRITGSGAGCGDHWPSCQGEIVPTGAEGKTVIEYTHRVTSALLGPMCLVLVIWAVRLRGWRSDLARVSSLTALFVVFEALIGALLVKKGLVAEDDSVARAVVVALHLGNTLLLTAVASLCAWLGSGHAARLRLYARGRGGEVLALAGVMVVSMTGAVTALGDTLFPVAPTLDSAVFGRVREGLDAGSHFLVRLRAVHPLLASAVGLWLLWTSSQWLGRAAPGSDERLLARAVHALVWAQLACGFVNVALSAPGWLQLLHLALAQGLWVSLVLAYSSPRTEPERD